VFIAFLVVILIVITLRFRGIDNGIDSVLGTASYFAFFVLPVAFVVSILISISNVNLMRREGVNWRNMQGFRMEGIGSPTRRYFWVNAFIREFVATLASQKKRHLKVTAALLFGVVFMVVFLFY